MMMPTRAPHVGGDSRYLFCVLYRGPLCDALVCSTCAGGNEMVHIGMVWDSRGSRDEFPSEERRWLEDVRFKKLFCDLTTRDCLKTCMHHGGVCVCVSVSE
jgi:hypothetical protein